MIDARTLYLTCMSSKTRIAFLHLCTVMIFSLQNAPLFAQSVVNDWSEMISNRVQRADLIAFEECQPQWLAPNLKPKLRSTIPEMDPLELALQAWTTDLELENECVQALISNGMERWQILQLLRGLYGIDIELALSEEDVPPSFQWLPILLSGYDHAFEGTSEKKGLWHLSVEDSEKFGLHLNEMTDDRMLAFEATAAAAEKIRRLYRRFPQSPERALVAYNKGMAFATRWSGKPGYDRDLDQWLTLYRVVARLMVNIESPPSDRAWGQCLAQWEPIAYPGRIHREALFNVLGMTPTIQHELLPWWTGEKLSELEFDNYAPLLPARWAILWNNRIDQLSAWTAGSELTIHDSKSPNYPVQAPPTEASYDPCILYEVKAGDTLWNISQRHKGTSPENLAEINNIVDYIRIGQIICIPKAE